MLKRIARSIITCIRFLLLECQGLITFPLYLIRLTPTLEMASLTGIVLHTSSIGTSHMPVYSGITVLTWDFKDQFGNHHPLTSPLYPIRSRLTLREALPPELLVTHIRCIPRVLSPKLSKIVGTSRCQ